MADFGIKAGDAAAAYRKKAGEFLKVYGELRDLDQEYTALGVDVNLPVNYFSDITNTEFTDGVGAAQTVMAAIVTNQTNLFKLSDGSHR